MAEETTAPEQEQGSEEGEKSSKMDRLKGRLKELTGSDSGDEAASSGSDDSGDEDGSAEGSAEGSDEASASGEQEEGEETSGGYSLDDVDPQEPTQDDEKARAQIDKLERDGPPENLADWPRGKAMYLTFSGAEGEATYEEAETTKLGPSSTRHLADGSVEVQGEIVEDPSPYKGDKSVFEESEELGMDKGAKGEDSSDDEGSSDEDSQAQSDDSASAESGSDESAGAESQSDESSANSQSDGSAGAEQEENRSESESAEAS